MFNKTSTAIIIARHQTNVKNWHQINVQGDTSPKGHEIIAEQLVEFFQVQKNHSKTSNN